MNDNVFVRLYGDDAPYLVDSGDYASINQPLLAIGMKSTQINNSENRKMLKEHYEQGAPVIITDIGYSGIKNLHKMLGSDATIGYIKDDKYYHCETPRKFGYYGIVKNADGDINQFYYEFEENGVSVTDNVLRGFGIDEIGEWINTNVPTNQSDDLASPTNDLTQISSAQNMTFRVVSGPADAFYVGGYPVVHNTYAINVTIYSAHSNSDGSDYYYVEQEGVYNFNNQYKGQYKYDYFDALSKIEEFYGSNVATDCFLGIDSKYVNIMRLAPATTEGQSTITSGLSWSLGGSATVNQNGVAATVNGGITVNNSRSFTVDNVSVFNKSADNGSNAKWEYVLKKTESKYAFFDYGQVDLIGCSNTGHSTFIPFNHWIWRILPEGRPEGDTIRLNCNLLVYTTSSRGYLQAPFYTAVDERNHPFSKQFILDFNQAPLPPLK